MSGWFDAKSFTSLAKSALSQAQKQIDKALEAVADEDSDSDESDGMSMTARDHSGVCIRPGPSRLMLI